MPSVKYLYTIEIENSKGEKKNIKVIASTEDLAQRGIERVLHVPLNKQTIKKADILPIKFMNFGNVDLYVPDDFK